MKQLEVVAQCKASVRIRDLQFPRYKDCTRSAVQDGYCRQHHPDSVKKRQDESMRRWEARQEARARPFRDASKLNDVRVYLISLGPPGTPLTASQSARLWKLINL